MDDIGPTSTLEPLTADDDALQDIIDSATRVAPLQLRPRSSRHAQDPTTSRLDEPIKLHTCGFCGSAFPSYPALLEHKSQHGGSRPYVCHVCEKQFTQKAHLIIHRRTHTGEKPYSCHICHKRFAQSSHLNSHKRVHTGEKPFFCSICSMGFCRRQRLEAHLQMHADPVPEDLVPDPKGSSSRPKVGDLLSSDSKRKYSGQLLGKLDGSGKGGRGADTSEVVSSSYQQSVFPDLSSKGSFLEGETTGFDSESLNIKQEYTEDGEDGEYGVSPSPPPLPFSSTPKSRRKPAFVRRFGSENTGATAVSNQNDSETLPAEEDDTESTPGQNTSHSFALDKRSELSAHEAAVDALIKMATGTENDDMDDMIEHQAMADINIPNMLLKHSLIGNSAAAVHNHQRSMSKAAASSSRVRPIAGGGRQTTSLPPSASVGVSPMIRTNTRVSLVDFTSEDLLRHLMSRDDVYRCDFCRVIFHDSAMYHLHRSMHDKMDIRCCNLCGKLLLDKYDFTAHFLSQHK